MNALATVNGDLVQHPAEVRSAAEDAFTDAIGALSRLYMLASDAGIESLKLRTELATRELVAWHHDKPRGEPGATLVNFPPRYENSEDETKG